MALVDGKMLVPKVQYAKNQHTQQHTRIIHKTVNMFIFTTKSLLLSSVHSFVSGRVFSFQKQSQLTVFTH
jgi:hypothetical protein